MRSACLLFCVACSATEAPPALVPPAVELPHFEEHWGTVADVDEGQNWGHPDQVPQGQMPRRLEVEHLRNSIPLLFDGIQWTDNLERPMWDVLSRTLGEADYLEITEMNNEPSPLFAKFMDDMAAQVCKKALDRDALNAQAETRLLLRYAGDVKQNLRWLRLKLHGVLVLPGDDSGLAGYDSLHETIVPQAGVGKAWLGVCMAMLTAPDFLTY
ncbi:MAG: hypothetical protein OSB21_09895 [Myxococcota bacterium]|nr:hypothetical protein [Myxococcota bacterium]